jgi:hypothetical protein
LDAGAIEAARERTREALARDDVRDGVYRIFHSSFKMYRLGTTAIDLAGAMFLPLGLAADAPANDVLGTMRRFRLNELFVEIFRRTAATDWSPERNERKAWAEDARQLTSGFLIVRETVEASLEAMDRMCKGEGFLHHPRAALDPTDALFLEVWTDLGTSMRYRIGDSTELEDKCRELLRKRGAK